MLGGDFIFFKCLELNLNLSKSCLLGFKAVFRHFQIYHMFSDKQYQIHPSSLYNNMISYIVILAYFGGENNDNAYNITTKNIIRPKI